MQKYYSIKHKIKKTDIAWLAGILDGEGCIWIHKSPPNPKKGEISTKYYLSVRISMAHKKTIFHIQKILKFGNSIKRRKLKLHYQTQYAWEVASLQALAFLKLIYPYLVTKRKEAKIGMEFCQIPRISYMQQGLPKKILNLRRKYWKKLRSLKHYKYQNG